MKNIAGSSVEGEDFFGRQAVVELDRAAYGAGGSGEVTATFRPPTFL